MKDSADFILMLREVEGPEIFEGLKVQIRLIHVFMIADFLVR